MNIYLDSTADPARWRRGVFVIRATRMVSILLFSFSILTAQQLRTSSSGSDPGSLVPSTSSITKTSGFSWSPLGSGLDGDLWTMAVSGTDVYAGGLFATAGGNAAGNIAKWDGSAWSALGSGIPNFYVEGMAASGSDLYAGGLFFTAGGVSANCIAKWDGSNWSALGSGIGGEVAAVAVGGGNVYAAGAFGSAGEVSASNIAKWDGANWSALGSGVDAFVYAVVVSGTDVYVGGQFTTAGGSPAYKIAKWDGSNWSSLGSGLNDYVFAIAVDGSDVYVGGRFTTAGGNSANHIAKWDGSAWSEVGKGVDGDVRAIATWAGDVYIGGSFTTATQGDGITTVSTANTAKWSGGLWSAIGGGTNNTVRAMAVDAAAGIMMVGGSFTTVDEGASASKMASFSDASNPLAVTLTNFAVEVQSDGTVRAHWTTASELDNAGFELERRTLGTMSTDAGLWSSVAFIAGAGTSAWLHEYEYVDTPPASGHYAYRLKQIDRNGTCRYTGETEIEASIAPKEFRLSQNYPNPFNPTTTIEFTIQEDGHVLLMLYDVTGREVATLLNDDRKAGYYQSVTFDASRLGSGTYLYRLEVVSISDPNKRFVDVKKMILLK